MDTSRTKSVSAIATAKTYKPRPNTAAGMILMSLAQISSQNIFTSKEEVQAFIKDSFEDNVKTWTSLKVLAANRMIEISVHGSNEFKLT